MTNQPTIRAAKAYETEAMSKLAMRSKAYWGYSKSFMEACRDELIVTAADLNSADFHYWVAERDSELLGYYAIEKLNDNNFELDALFVDPPFIGKGLGRVLMEHAKGLVKQLGGHMLIIQGDPNAEKFYRAAGGQLIGMRESESISGRDLPLFTIDLASDNVASIPS